MCVLNYLVLCAVFVTGFTGRVPLADEDDIFELSVVHINDFHARFEETSTTSGDCKDEATCIGGFSRMYKEVETLLADKPGSLLLNAGDNFQGTLYYTLGKWNITQEFLNKLPFDATVLGNHEFDDKIAGVVPFIKALNHPVVVSNIDDSLEPTMQGIYSKSTVVERNGKKIGIIGVILSTTNEIASTEDLKFYPESPAVNEEAERLVREEGVFTNIVLSHCGYDIEQAIAANASEKIGLVVGAHSHTFLYTGDNPPGPDTPRGPYPTIVTSVNGKQVLVVQASAYTKYIGNITVFYGSDGEVVGHSGAPIFLAHEYEKDENINKDLEPWKEMVDSVGSQVLGSSLVQLSASCYTSECTLGNFVTDAMIFAYTDRAEEGVWTYASIAVANAGGLRSSINPGDVTYNDLIIAQPFSNTWDVGEMQGKYIKEMMEQNMQPYSNERIAVSISLLQVSGLHVVFNTSRPVGDMVQSIKVRCQACVIPVYEDIDLEKYYRIVVLSFLVEGGDGYTAISNNLKNLTTGGLDIELLANYMAQRSPIFQEVEGRIIIYSDEDITVRGLDLET